MELLFDNGHENINGDGDPDLRLDGVFGGSVKGFDPKMLFDPLEEQLDLPPAFVDLGNGQGRQREVVGQEDKSSVLFEVVEADTPQFFGIILAGVEAVKGNNLVALQPR